VCDWGGQWQNGRLLCAWLRSGDTLIRKIRWEGANLWTGSHFGLTLNESEPTYVILLSFPILSNCKFSFHMHSLNRLGNFFWNPKWMIDDPEIIKDWMWRLTFNLDQLFLGISANVTHGNPTVVYEMDISQLQLSLDECCPLDWMPISLRVHNTVQL
jgi:hypothetical protein